MSTQDDYHVAKFDQGKARYDLLRPGFEKAVADVLTFGADKYAAHSWMYVPDMENRYYSALRRHLDQHRTGQLYDDESGLLHLAHAACNMYFLLQWELEKLEHKKSEAGAQQAVRESTGGCEEGITSGVVSEPTTVGIRAELCREQAR